MLGQEFAVLGVAVLHDQVGGVLHVGEQDGAETDSLTVAGRARYAPEKLVDGGEERILITQPREPTLVLHLRQGRVRDARGEASSHISGVDVPTGVEDQGRRCDPVEYRTSIIVIAGEDEAAVLLGRNRFLHELRECGRLTGPILADDDLGNEVRESLPVRLT